MEFEQDYNAWSSDWIFTYGSLMWNPPFEFEERESGRLRDFCRDFNMLSFSARGTRDEPGLVLGLEKRSGSFCDGMAFRISKDSRLTSFNSIMERENRPLRCYSVEMKEIELRSRTILAMVLIPLSNHEQYKPCLLYTSPSPRDA
eukprot:TRINITY_DN1946_c0_g1_i2.p1 TRINITY_DN1946_c0_g1~~TRINITY_DN1946_c0_g1_i2.p1  ORF type:complete len:145 (-),score=20.92 TRINITY_DN1946_c0_g1_i2:28-462(-)